MINEQRSPSAAATVDLPRQGLAAANVTGLIAFAGLIAMFFFLTLYMQNVLGYSPIQTGAAYLPLCLGVGVAAGMCSQLLTRTGTRPVVVVGALVASAGPVPAVPDPRRRLLSQPICSPD